MNIGLTFIGLGVCMFGLAMLISALTQRDCTQKLWNVLEVLADEVKPLVDKYVKEIEDEL